MSFAVLIIVNEIWQGVLPDFMRIAGEERKLFCQLCSGEWAAAFYRPQFHTCHMALEEDFAKRAHQFRMLGHLEKQKESKGKKP